MEKITIQFLGTGNAIPTKLRNHTGILLSFANEQILIDCGENIQRQCRHAGISPAKLTRILITHWHGAHILGLPGLLQTLAMGNYSKTLQLYGPAGTRRHFHTILELLHGLRIPVEVHEIQKGIFLEKKIFQIEALPMEHGIPALAYAIILKDQRHLDRKKIRKLSLPNTPMLGELQAGKDILFQGKKILAKNVSFIEKGKKVSIILDTALHPNTLSIAKNSDLLIAEATFAREEEALAKEYKHLTAEHSALIAKKAKVKKLILTHISERYEHNLNKIEKEAKKIFKNTVIAKDFDKYII